MTKDWKNFARMGTFFVTLGMLSYFAHFFFIRKSFVPKPLNIESYAINSKVIQGTYRKTKTPSRFKDLKSGNRNAYNFTSLAPQVEGSIPKEIASSIKHFLFFVGTSRSGTSFVQRFLNSHPHAIISDEMGIFKHLRRNGNLDSKKEIAELIFRFVCSHLGKHQNGLMKGYLLSWKDKIAVLGDKKPPAESVWIYQHFDRFLSLYQKLSEIFGSIKVISMVRDPYEVVLKCVIANLVKRSGLKIPADGKVPYEKVVHINKKTGLYHLSVSKLMINTEHTWKQVNVTVELVNSRMYDIKVYQMEDFILNGKKYLYELCDWLDLECFDNFVEYVMENKLQESRSRKHDFFWPKKVKTAINEMIRRYPSYYLNGEKYIM